MVFKDQVQNDLDIFFNETEFAQSATLANGSVIPVYFDQKDDVVFDTGLESDVSASVPSITAKAEDVESLHHGNSIVIDTTTYYIIDMDPPQSGVRKLYLSEDR